MHYFRGWPLGETLCVASVQIRWALTFANHLSLALIAFSRLALLKKSTIGELVFNGHAAKVPLLSIWIIAISGVFMNLFGVCNISYTVIGARMSYRKWRENKQHLM